MTTPTEDRRALDGLREDLDKAMRRLKMLEEKPSEIKVLAGDGAAQMLPHIREISFPSAVATRQGHRAIVGGGLVGGFAGLIHYDYVVDSSYTGTDGTSVTLGTGATSKIYKTITAALAAATTENLASGSAISMLINEGLTGIYNEDITVPSTLSEFWMIGEGRGKITIGTTTGNGLTCNSGLAHFKNLAFRGGTGAHYAFTTAGSASAQLNFEDCSFSREMFADLQSSNFLNCVFSEGYLLDSTHNLSQVNFINCNFGLAMTWAGSQTYVFFINCLASAAITLTGNLSYVSFVGCRLQSFVVQDAAATMSYVTFDPGTVFQTAPGANGSINFDTMASSVGVDIACTFTGNGTNPCIKSSTTNTNGVLVRAQFGTTGSGVADVTGKFINCTFGPCSPGNFGLQADVGSTGNIYLGSGTVTGAAALTGVFVTLPQLGTAAPVHTAPEGTFFWDKTNNHLYSNNNGSTGWTQIDGGAGGAATTEPYVTIGNTAGLSAERALTAGQNVSVTDDGANTTVTLKALQADVYLPGVASNAFGNGDTNDYALSATVSRLRASTSAGAPTITGMAGGAAGRLVIIENVNTSASSVIILAHNRTSSAGNRFFCPGAADFTLMANGAVVVIWDTTTNGWVVVGGRVPTATATVSLVHRTYVWRPDQATATDIVTGNAQGGILCTNDGSTSYTETVERIIISSKIAGTSGTVVLEYNSGNDYDTESWTTVQSNALGSGQKGYTKSSAFTAATIPAARLLRMNITALAGSWQDMTVILETTYTPTSAVSVVA